MARYDWRWGWRGEPRDDFGGPRGRYGEEYRGWGEAWGRPWGGWEGPGPARQWGYPADNVRGYDRGLYGRDYPGFRRYPGGGYEAEYGGWPAYPRQPFLPPEAYQRHPELGRQQRHGPERWPERAPEHPMGVGMDDDEIRQAVRQSLFQDNWLEADRIEVQVNGGVVTLSGEVGDYLEARYAWDDAWETGGVRGVVNQLTVRVDQPERSQGSATATASASATAAAKRKKGEASKKSTG